VPTMDTLLAIATLGQRAYGRWRFQQLLFRILVIAALTLIIAMMVATLLIGLLYAGYSAMRDGGVAVSTAGFIIGSITLLIIVFLTYIILTCTKCLQDTAQPALTNSSVAVRTGAILEAFWDGIMTPPTKPL